MIRIKTALLGVLVALNCALAQGTKELFDIHKGINLSEWLEKADDFENKESSVTLANIDSLRKYGFDHVRIPVSEEVLFDEALNVRQNIFGLLKNRIDYCQKIGLKVIVDLHAARLHSFAKTGNALFVEPQPIEKFLTVWAKMQALFRDYPVDFLAYECLNEPAAAKDKHHLWNNVLAEWVQFIRKTEKKRFLFIGTNRGNQLWTLKYLKLPQDERLVLSLHYYYPFLFTHFHPNDAYAKSFNGKVHYPGKTIDDDDYDKLPKTARKEYESYREYYDKKRIYEDFSAAIKFSKKNNIPLNIGEFGCRRFNNPEDRLQWFKDVTEVFKENGISYTLWGLNGAGFGIWINGRLDKPMLEAIK
jgi:endoglucanase